MQVMRLLVLGGTRFLGRATARAAVTLGDEVVCAARGISGAVPAGATFVAIDRDESEAYSALAEFGDFDAVIDVSNRPSQVRSALAALGRRTHHWIYISSISAYADNETPGQAASTAPLLPPAALDVDEADLANFGPCKVACEQAVLDAMGAERTFICRAGLIVGPEDPSGRFTYWPNRIARGGEILAPGNRDDAVQWIDVRDLAKWLIDVAHRKIAGIFDGLCEPIGRADFLDGVARGVGARGVGARGVGARGVGALGVGALGVGNETPEFTWVTQQFLEEQQVNPWYGPRSLPLWTPVPEYGGLLSRDGGPAKDSGLACRDLAETARSTLAWQRDTSSAIDASTSVGSAPVTPLRAGLTAEEEAEVLAAWHSAG